MTTKERLQAIEDRYLGGQSAREFFSMGGNAREYAAEVFTPGVIFPPDVDPTDDTLGIGNADDLAHALERAREL